jgi:hypothetical protein
MTSRSDRCPTSSGRFVCSAGAAGHAGECVTREQAPPWVGPARQPRHIAIAVAARDSETLKREAELRREIVRAERRAANAEARAGMTHVVPLQRMGADSRIVESSLSMGHGATTLPQDELSPVDPRGTP